MCGDSWKLLLVQSMVFLQFFGGETVTVKTLKVKGLHYDHAHIIMLLLLLERFTQMLAGSITTIPANSKVGKEKGKKNYCKVVCADGPTSAKQWYKVQKKSISKEAS